MTIIWHDQTLKPGPRPWSQDESKRAVRLKAQGKTYAEIGVVLGRTAGAVSAHLFERNMTPEKRLKYRKTKDRCPSRQYAPTDKPLDKGIQIINRPTPEMLADRDRREAMPHRDLTGAFFGDPPVGLSALEGRR